MPSLVVLVMYDMNLFDDVISAWREAGAPAVTILDSVGTRELEEQGRGDDLPLIPTIRDLMRSEEAPRKTIFSVVDDDRVQPIADATERVIGDLSEPHRGILFALPVTLVRGQR